MSSKRQKAGLYRLSLFVENKPGVLARIVGLISGRGYNIQTLNVGPTEDGTVSRMKIGVLGSARVVDQIILQLRNCVNVIEVTSRVVACLAAAMAAFVASAVTVSTGEGCEGMGTVSWSQTAEADGTATVSLSAVAADGCVFAGWDAGGAEADWPQDVRLAKLSGVTVPTGASVIATFARKADDGLCFDAEAVLGEMPCGVPFSAKLDVDSLSFPTLAVSGLPPGLKFNRDSLVVSGTPTTSGVSTVSVSGKNASGFPFSQYFKCRVDNISAARLYGDDCDIEVDRYWFATFDELFTFSGEAEAVSLSASIPGLTWNQSWQLLYGTPTKTGVYVVTATVDFKGGGRETATLLVSVSRPDPAEYGVDLDAMDWLVAGDVLERRSSEIGYYSGGEGVVSVSGLPPGLSVETWTDDGVECYGVFGKVRSAGIYEVVIKVVVEEYGEMKTVVTSREIVVDDAVSIYLDAGYFDESHKSRGSVSGGGPVSPVSTASVKATAKSGYVFAGWYDQDGDPVQVDGVDYRSPAMSFSPDTDFFLVELRARFEEKGADSEVEVFGLDGAEFEFAADGFLYESFSVSSLSLPTLTFKGLPAGVSVEPVFCDEYCLVYDSLEAKKSPSPGRYPVTATAVNASKAKVVSEFVVTVANLMDPRIKVEDDYGELVPGEAMEPIDLAGAVDFARGETLSVSGLPMGLSFNKKDNAKSGVVANTITGTPTKPGYYTLAFTAKVVAGVSTNSSGKISYSYATATATSFLRVLPFPELSVELDDEAAAAGCKVSGGGSYKSGTKVVLKATAPKGWVFAGWLGVDAGDAPPFSALSPSLSLVSDRYDTAVHASFLRVEDDWLWILDPSDETGIAAVFDLGEDVSDTEYADILSGNVDTASYPVLSLSGLPPGVKFDAKSFRLYGKPSKPGMYNVVVSAKNAGGYSFTRVLKFAVRGADGCMPQEQALPNPAGINFSPVDGFTTGVLVVDGSALLVASPHPQTGEDVKKISASGVPSGLRAVANVVDGTGYVSLSGIPDKPGICTMSVSVSYVGGASAKSQHAVVVEDGGAFYLAVRSDDETTGTAAGSGVYSSGAKVTVSAKPARGYAFAGWRTGPTLDGEPFAPMTAVDGVDYRTASASFAFRPDDFDGDLALYAVFATETEDAERLRLLVPDASAEADGSLSLDLGACVTSLSLPKLSVSGLPAGVKFDAKTMIVSGKATKPGVYSVRVSATNAAVKKARDDTSATFLLTVPNLECAALPRLRPEVDAYGTINPGVAIDSALIDCTPAEGWSAKASGLPAGLKFDAATGVIFGIPTAKAGLYTVTFTASKKGEANQVATITLNVEALPAWAVGGFEGAAGNGADKRGAVALTIATNGKISGKLVEGGKTWTLSASGFSRVDASPESEGGSPVFFATLVGKAGKEIVTKDVEVTAAEMDDGNGGTCLIGLVRRARGGGFVETALPDWTAYQNLWKRADTKADMPVFEKSVTTVLDLVEPAAPSDRLTVVFKANGAVSFSGKVAGVGVSGSSQLVWTEGGWRVTLYAPPKGAFAGLCETFSATVTVSGNVVSEVSLQAVAE